MTTARSTRRAVPVGRAVVLPSLVVGLICALAGLLAEGSSGLYGGLIGVGLVVGFFWLGRAALLVVRDVTPEVFLVFGLLTYLLQVVVLLAVFAGFRRHDEWSDAVSTTTLGLTIIACTVVWTVGLIIASRRDRSPIYDLGDDAR